jgi:hypothetical protein
VFLYQSHQDYSAIWHLFQSSIYNFCFSQFEKCHCRLLIPPTPQPAGSVATTTAADPVNFEEIAAEQNCCAETQRLLGSTSLKLAFRQTGAHRLAGDVSTGVFRPIVPLKFRKDIFNHFHYVAYPGRLASCHIISSRFVWRGLSSNITAWSGGCLA